MDDLVHLRHDRSAQGGHAHSWPELPAGGHPFIQSEKFDKDCEYIKEWVPELKDIPAKDIHNWYDAHKNYGKDATNYPAPIVDYKTAKGEMIQMYKKAK